eukprot:c23196_g1_i2 orf=952-2292(+)
METTLPTHLIGLAVHPNSNKLPVVQRFNVYGQLQQPGVLVCGLAKIHHIGGVRAVAREIIPVNSRGNSLKANGESKLQNAKLEGPNGTTTMPKDLGTFPVFPGTESLCTAITVIAAALRVVDSQKKAEKEKQAEIQMQIGALRRGMIVEDGLVYRQTFVIRSYEVGLDRTASIETIANLFQETALNHVGMSDFVGDGMGTTHAMMRHRLIWVVTRMHVQVTRYPVWGDVVEIDSWVTSSGKNGMRRDFLVRDYSSGQILTRATSNWAMMNQDTRKLSKMPNDVRAEISPYFLDRSVLKEEPCQRISKINDFAPYIKAGLVPKLHDMDMNQHVNHVKYIGWVLESIPQSLLVAYELKTMTLEYRKECSPSDVVTSLMRPDPPFSPGIELATDLSSNVSSASPPCISDPCIISKGSLQYIHLLKLQSDGSEILRGKTEWRLKEHYLQM